MLEQVRILNDNHLLNKMPISAFKAIQMALEPVQLPVGATLSSSNTIIEHVYFFCDGIVSSKGPAGITIIGREGMSGGAVLAGATQTSYDTIMRLAGSSLRILAADLIAAADDCKPLRVFFERHVQMRIVQRSQLALLAYKFNPLERMSRWLLMCHDRVDGDTFPLSRAFLKELVGGSDKAFDEALRRLKEDAIIRSTPGWVEVRGRAELIQLAGGAYDASDAS